MKKKKNIKRKIPLNEMPYNRIYSTYPGHYWLKDPENWGSYGGHPPSTDTKKRKEIK